jgi:ice-binding like protein
MNRTQTGVILTFAAIAILIGSATAGQAQAAQAGGPAGSAAILNSCLQKDVPLGSAANFTVLGGSAVTNTGATFVKGDLGVSPGTSIAGFPPGKVNGTIHTADAVASTAQTDLAGAISHAQGLSNCAMTLSGNIGGKTLGPGLYVSTSSLAISSGNLTLNAAGHPNAVFIIVMASTLVLISGHQVILAGGAMLSHVFFVVGSSATLGTYSKLLGNILASTSITLATGAKVCGRSLANTGAVTMDDNQVLA